MDDFNPIPLARSSDPVTSHLAAASAKQLQAKHQAKVLEALKANGPMGKSMIAVRSGLGDVAVCRRLPELERDGLIEQTGCTVKSGSGRAEREWMLKP